MSYVGYLFAKNYCSYFFFYIKKKKTLLIVLYKYQFSSNTSLVRSLPSHPLMGYSYSLLSNAHLFSFCQLCILCVSAHLFKKA